MAGSLHHDSGGILGLLDLLEEHWEAIDYDLLTLGLDIHQVGSERLDWRRFRAIVTHLPASSALARAVHGEQAVWSVTDHLLALAVDALQAGNWQRGGGKGKRPKPIPRPGVEDENRRRLGTASMSLEEAQALFDRINR